MNADTEKTVKPRRRWIHFRLRTLLIVVTVLSVPFGWSGWRLEQVRREQATITWIKETGGYPLFRLGVTGIDNTPLDFSWWEESTERWFGERLRMVSFVGNQVSDLSPLAELKNLERLFLSSTQVNDLSPLEELKNIEQLYLDNTQVIDLSPLTELKNLEYLYLDNTQVSDLSPLEELMNLEHLHLNNTLASDEQVKQLRQALPNCEIRYSIRVEK